MILDSRYDEPTPTQFRARAKSFIPKTTFTQNDVVL